MTDLTDEQIETLSMTDYPAYPAGRVKFARAVIAASKAQPVQPAPSHEKNV